MSRDSGNVTTQTGPPEYLSPHFNTALDRSRQLYQGGGTPVTPFAPETEEALQLQAAQARAGSPITQQAGQLAQDTLAGNYLNGNPYLDALYNRAAGNVVNTVQSNFGLAGRNVGGNDAAGVATGRLNDLAASMYGGAYEAERGRQNQVLGMSPQLADASYTDFGRLADVGAQREQLAREQARQPGSALDEYLMRIQGMPGQASSYPTERNLLAGAAGGAQLGSSFGPWGMLGGGILGVLG